MSSLKAAMAGTLDSCDIQVRIEEAMDLKNEIFLKSVVEQQFGAHILGLIEGVLKKHSVDGVVVQAVDRGALDCTIIARVESAVMRYKGLEDFTDWEVIHHG